MSAVALAEQHPEVKQLGTEVSGVVARAHALTVVDIPSRLLANELGVAIATLEKQAKEKFALIKKPIDQAHKEVCTWEHEVVDPLTSAKRYLSAQIGTFNAEQERIRRAEEARLQEEARVDAEAEARRLADEQAIEDAVELEAAGDIKAAEAVLNNPVPQAVYVPPVILPKAVPTVKNEASSRNWKFRITDVNKIPRRYMVPDEKTIGQIVRALKDKTDIEGIEVYPEDGARFKAGA